MSILLGLIAVLRAQMRPAVTYQVAWSVCLSVCRSSPAKAAKPIEMPFGLRTRVGPMKHALDGGAGTLWKGAILRRKGPPVVKCSDCLP